MSKINELVDLVQGTRLRSESINRAMVSIINHLKSVGNASPGELKELIDSRKTYAKATRKLRDIGMLYLNQDKDNKKFYTLTPHVFRDRMNQLIKGVVRECE